MQVQNKIVPPLYVCGIHYHWNDAPIGDLKAFSERQTIRRNKAAEWRKRGYVPCDGNHTGPRCDDPRCWNDED